MSLIFKSKLLRNEIKHWILVVCLFFWGLSATVYALSKNEKTVLIGIDDAGARLITSSDDRLIKSELKGFLQGFLQNYYEYDEKTFIEKLGFATEMMSDELWQRNKTHLLDLNQKLQKTPLVQSMEIESIDLIDQGRVEAVVLLNIKARLAEQKVRLKVILEFRKHERNDKNPWQYEISELAEQEMELSK